MDSRNLTDSVVNPLKKDADEVNRILILDFMLVGKGHSVAPPLNWLYLNLFKFADYCQHSQFKGIHTNSACSFTSSLFYTSCIYFKHSPHWNLWPVTWWCACTDTSKDFVISTSIKDVQTAQEKLRIVKEVVLELEIKVTH